MHCVSTPPAPPTKHSFSIGGGGEEPQWFWNLAVNTTHWAGFLRKEKITPTTTTTTTAGCQKPNAEMQDGKDGVLSGFFPST